MRRGVPGDLIETGVYRGGTTVFMKACLRALGAEDRQVFVCDTFQPQGDPPTLAAKLFFIPVSGPNGDRFAASGRRTYAY